MQDPGRGSVDRRVVRDPPPSDPLAKCPSDDPVDPLDRRWGVGALGSTELEEPAIEAVEIRGRKPGSLDVPEGGQDRVVEVAARADNCPR